MSTYPLSELKTIDTDVLDIDRVDIIQFYRELYRERLELANNAIEGELKLEFQTDIEGLTFNQSTTSTFDGVVEESLKRRMIVVSNFSSLPECRFELTQLLESLMKKPRDEKLLVFLDHFEEHHQIAFDDLKQNGNYASFESVTRTIDRMGVRYFQSVQPLLRLSADRTTKNREHLSFVAADLNHEQSLTARNQHLLNTVEERLRIHPNATAIVFVGEVRLKDGTLLNKLASLLKPLDKPPLLLLQAWEAVYWHVLERAENEGGVTESHLDLLKEPALKWTDDVFTVTPIPPLVKLDSFLTLTERQESWPGFPLNRAAQEIRRSIRSALHLPYATDSDVNVWVDPSVYCCADLNLLVQIKAGKPFDHIEAQTLIKQMATHNSYYLPAHHLIYLATMNGYHVGEEIGHSVRIGYTGEWQQGGPEFSHKGWLFYNLLNEAAGYLCSKIIAPGRRPSSEGQQDAIKTLHRVFRKRQSYKSDKLGRDEINELSHLAGYGLGELLYQRLQFSEIDADSLHPLFQKPLTSEAEVMQLFEEVYALADPARHLINGSGQVPGITGETIKDRLPFVAGFYLLLFFLPAIMWNDMKPGLFRFPEDFSAAFGRDALIAVGGALAVIAVSIVLSVVLPAFGELTRVMKRLLGALTIEEVFLIAALSGLCEELLFRGAIQPMLGIVPTALIFGMVHFIPDKRFYPWTVFAVLAGLLFGVAYDYTGNLLVPVVMHFLINFVNMLWITKRKADV